jgi:hypothetical protein
MCRHEKSLHHLKLVGDEDLVAPDSELQSHLFRHCGFGVAKRSIQHGLANAQHGRLHQLDVCAELLAVDGCSTANARCQYRSLSKTEKSEGKEGQEKQSSKPGDADGSLNATKTLF